MTCSTGDRAVVLAVDLTAFNASIKDKYASQRPLRATTKHIDSIGVNVENQMICFLSFFSYTKVHITVGFQHTRMYFGRKVHGANMGPIWGRQDPGGPHVGPMNLAIWVCNQTISPTLKSKCSHVDFYVVTGSTYIFLLLLQIYSIG